MDKKLAFQILGIAETKEEEPIRSSYLALLKDTNPEDDPEGFKRLREAYEEALRSAAEHSGEEEEEPQGEVGIWMKRVRETYRNVFLRRDAEIWKGLFADEVCVGFDSFLEARGQLLGFFSGHSFLPRTVWMLLDQVFHVMEDFDALKEEFHVNFLKHIQYHVNSEDFLDYSLFEAQEDYKPESDEDTDQYIKEYFQIKSMLEDGETEGASQMLSDIKRHGVYHPYEDVERLRLYIRQEESEKGKELAESLLARYPQDGYVQVWTGKIFSDAGDEERGYALWQAVLEREPDYYMAKYFAVGYYKRKKQWYEAKKYVYELLRVNGRDDDLLEKAQEIDREILPLIQEAYDRGEGFGDLTKEEVPLYLARTIYNMERYEESLALLEKDPELLKKEEKNLNLKTLTLYGLERYEEAIPVFAEYLECLEEIEDEEERAPKMAQAHQVLGFCYFGIENREEGERELRTAISMERDAGNRLRDRYYLADRFLFFKDYEKAVEECDEILSEDENYYPAYLVRQEASYYLKRAQQVVDDYYRAIDLYAGYDKPYLYAAMIFYDYSQYKDAVGVIERATENQAEFSGKLRFQEAKIRRMLAESTEEREKVMELLDALLFATEEENGELKENTGTSQDDPKRAELLFEKALVFWDDGKLVEAVALLQEALKLEPDKSSYHLALGNLLRDMRNYAEALKEYKRVEEVYHHVEFFFGMGVCHQAAKEWRQAAYYYKKAVEQDETYRDTNLRLYRCYEALYCDESKKADYEEAMRYINKQLEITENRGYRLWDRGNLHEDAMETESAVADYREALAVGTVPEEERYILWENIGCAYKNNRQFEEAYEAYRRAVETMKEKDASATSYRGMAECCRKMGDYEKAIACCREGLEIFPTDATLWNTLDDCYQELERPEEALRVEEERRKQAGETKEYYSYASYVLLAMGKVQEGLALFDEMKNSWLKRAADKEELAELYREWADHLTEACAYAEGAKKYQDAAALYGENWEKKFKMEWRTGKCYYMIGEREKAAQYAKKAIACLAQGNIDPEDYRSDPKYGTLQGGWLAWCDLMLGEKDKARQTFEMMEQQKPCASCGFKKCLEASFWLGCYYYCEGELDKAAEQFEETLKRDVKMTEAKFLLEKINRKNKRAKGYD